MVSGEETRRVDRPANEGDVSNVKHRLSRTAPFTLALSTGMLMLSLASGVRAATLDTLPETPAKRVVPLDAVVYEPCRDEEVKLAGTLSFQGSTAVPEEGKAELEYALEVTDVHGLGLRTGVRYDFVGESQGVVSHRERIVTADDFRLLARSLPGEIGRASAEPRYGVTFAVTLSEKGAIETVVPESVFTDETCLY
jgi:hypothetical protein